MPLQMKQTDRFQIFNKVHSKQAGTPAPCGSPMPLPATAAPLTSAEVDLISAWITAGALNNGSRSAMRSGPCGR